MTLNSKHIGALVITSILLIGAGLVNPAATVLVPVGMILLAVTLLAA